eukprot:4212408-Prymnesium_polylepis.1
MIAAAGRPPAAPAFFLPTRSAPPSGVRGVAPEESTVRLPSSLAAGIDSSSAAASDAVGSA